MLDALTAEIGTEYICNDCQQAIRVENHEKMAQKAAAEEDRRERVRQASQHVLVTTTPTVDGYRAVRYLGIESVEFVIGTGPWSEITTDLADFFGRRSRAFERKLQDAKQFAMQALKYVAAEKGANAVIGVDLDFTEFSGNRIGLILNGTLVQLEPITTD
jgi:uncharacterized protein YbjQ (UPF0145 family)